MLEISHTWTSTGSTGTWNTPVYLDFPPLELALYCQTSTIATTNQFQFQSALSSAGPWIVEASTAISANGSAGALDVLRMSGIVNHWIRPVTKTASTGAYTLRLIGAS